MTEYLTGKKPTKEQWTEWIEFFHANGFIVIHNVLTPEMCESLRKDGSPVLMGISSTYRI
jgi:hypothetical protein